MLRTSLGPSDRAALSLSDEDYSRFSRLVREIFGLAFPEKRRTELEIGVRRAFAGSTCIDLNRYFAVLSDPDAGALELERLVNSLTIGETHFFRDSGQFNALVNHVLPEIIERKRNNRTLRIWSAGCASGEEPYSIAMLLRELMPDIQDWSITILGTDINTQHLERAKRAVYGDWAFREARAKSFRDRYFTAHNNQYRLSPEICKMVTLSLLNLAEDSYPSYVTNTMFLDLILCRNVTIYFPDEVTRKVIGRFSGALVDGGWLVTGHSEYSTYNYQRFRARNFPGAILYQKANESLKDRERRVFDWLPTSTWAADEIAQPFTFEAPKIGLADFPPQVDLPAAEAFSGPFATAEEFSGAPAMNDFEQAQAFMTEGRVDRARDLYLCWLEKHPTDALACAQLGKAFADLGNWTEAERWCQLALSLNPLNLEGYYILALVYQHQGNARRAIEMMKKVIYINRTDALGHFSLANLYHSAGQPALALKFLDNAHRLLEKLPADDLVPRSGEILVARLMQTVIRQKHSWAKDTGLAKAPAE